MTGELFNPDAFEQLPGQLSMEALELEAPEAWRVTIATANGTSYLYPEATTPAAAFKSAQVTIDAYCWQGAEIVAVELEF